MQTQGEHTPGLLEALEKADDFICGLAGDTPIMDFCNANFEAGDALLTIRAAIAKATMDQGGEG